MQENSSSGRRLEPFYDGRIWELTQQNAPATSSSNKQFYSAARLYRIASAAQMENTVNQNLWSAILTGIQNEPHTIVADFDAKKYFTLNLSDTLQHVTCEMR